MELRFKQQRHSNRQVESANDRCQVKKINKTGKKVGSVQGSHVHLFNIVPDFLFKFMHFILYILKLQAGAQSAIEIRVRTQLYKRFVSPSLAILLLISSFGLHVVMMYQTFPHKLLCFICLFGPLGFSLNYFHSDTSIIKIRFSAWHSAQQQHGILELFWEP